MKDNEKLNVYADGELIGIIEKMPEDDESCGGLYQFRLINNGSPFKGISVPSLESMKSAISFIYGFKRIRIGQKDF